MRILAIGDPHGEFDFSKIKNEKIDLILVTGDLGKSDLLRKMWFDRIKAKKKGMEAVEDLDLEKRALLQAMNSTIVLMRRLRRIAPVYTIFGNLEELDGEVKKHAKKLKCKLVYLEKEFKRMRVGLINNRLLRKEGLRIGGLQFFWNFDWMAQISKNRKSLEKSKKDDMKAKKILQKFGELDILVCHQPPYGVLDKINFHSSPHNGLRAGSKVILNYVKKYQPRYVFCGHIHEAEGMKKVGKTEVYNLGEGGFKIFEI